MEKMKPIVIVLLILTVTHSCKNLTEHNAANVSKQDRTTSFVNLASKLKNDYKQIGDTIDGEFSRQKFLSDFPAAFDSFYHLYGFSDTFGAMPLYKDYEIHIKIFCEEANKNEIGADKIISLGIDAHWEADAVGLLQTCIREFVINKTDLTILKLKQLTQSKIHSFWKFYFDGPHPDDKGVQRQYSLIHAKVKALDSPMAKIMEGEYGSLLKEADVHGK
jgi:hypothetical protein